MAFCEFGMEYFTNRKWRAGPLFWCGVLSGSRVLQHVSVEDLCLSVWCLECRTDLWASLSSGSRSRPYCLRKQIAIVLSLIQIKTSRKTIMSHCRQKPSGWSSRRSHPTDTAGLCFFIENFFIDLLLSTSSWLSVTVFELKVQRAVLYFCLVIRLLIIHTILIVGNIFDVLL